MNARHLITVRISAALFILLFLAITLRADGFLYQLPEDGTWARFDMAGKAVEPDGKETTISGTVTLSSVGTVDVDGQKCRWIELGTEAKRNNQEFFDVEKLLIPEKRLAKGEDPLSHVLKAWHKHSMINGGAARERPDVQNPDSPGGKQVRGPKLRMFLHEPFDSPRLLGKTSIDSKLGPRECRGISAEEKVEGPATFNHKFLIRLHEDAPFGVVTWEVESKLEKDDKLIGTMTTKATLADFGKDAKSRIPEAK